MRTKINLALGITNLVIYALGGGNANFHLAVALFCFVSVFVSMYADHIEKGDVDARD